MKAISRRKKKLKERKRKNLKKETREGERMNLSVPPSEELGPLLGDEAKMSKNVQFQGPFYIVSDTSHMHPCASLC